jgi:hypothetical protein
MALTRPALLISGVLVSGMLLLAGCAATPAPAATSTMAPTPTPTPTPLTTQEQVDKQVRTTVNVYGQLVCNTLAAKPEARISDLVDTFIATYSPADVADADRLAMAHRLLTDSVAKYCPDQSPRVAEGIAAK